MNDEKMKPARVRFAPSPTGHLHLGGTRTALFDWLYARRTGGQFILRIEDTDQKRFNPESLSSLTRGLRWLGLDWEEGPDIGGPYGPYVQSERKALYERYAQQLVDAGKAYRCYTSEAELEELRKQNKEYDRRHRWLTPEQRAELAGAGRPYVVRFAVPLDGSTTVHDAIRGEVVVENQRIPVDPVLLKSDGMPTYHLAVVVDDHLMEISHILRGEEWLPSAPLHVLLYGAFGWEQPIFVHLPVILDPSGKGKMSKRKPVVDGREMPVFVSDFMQDGYLPDALFNFLCNTGWSFDAEREIFTRAEAIARFDVKDIAAKATALDYKKLEWLNGVYIRAMAPGELKQHLLPFVAPALGMDEAALAGDERFDHLIPLIQERIKFLTEAAPLIDWAFAPEITYPDPSLLIGKKLSPATSIEVLTVGINLLESVEPFTLHSLEDGFRAAAESMDIKVGSFFAPFRVAITGRTVSPPLFESMVVLGRAETVRRVRGARAALAVYAGVAV
jgi:glutamyl-tRNA synthetase